MGPSSPPETASPSRLPYPDRRAREGFTRAVEDLRVETLGLLCHGDFLHLRRMERIGRLCTLLGYATAWMLPNPLSALLIGQGVLTRWLLMHHISHGGYDQVPGVPARYTSRRFARGWRRFVDWFDWIHPEAWACEHNFLHHYHTGEEMDPDLAERHAELLRRLRCPRPVKYLVLLLLGITWKITYYAPNTLNEMAAHQRAREGGTPEDPIRPSNILDLRNPLVRRLWGSCYLPYAGFHFVLIPLLFLPLGPTASLFVLLNRVLAEFITNFHSYLIIGPNHSGEDLCRFEHHYRDKQEFYVNQVLGSVNYRTGSDWIDYPQMWLNYQIEHHLIPHLPMTQYQRIQPRVKALCREFGLPYLQEGVLRRFRKFLDICVGDGSMMVVGGAARSGSHAPSRPPVLRPADTD